MSLQAVCVLQPSSKQRHVSRVHVALRSFLSRSCCACSGVSVCCCEILPDMAQTIKGWPPNINFTETCKLLRGCPGAYPLSNCPLLELINRTIIIPISMYECTVQIPTLLLYSTMTSCSSSFTSSRPNTDRILQETWISSCSHHQHLDEWLIAQDTD